MSNRHQLHRSYRFRSSSCWTTTPLLAGGAGRQLRRLRLSGRCRGRDRLQHGHRTFGRSHPLGQLARRREPDQAAEAEDDEEEQRPVDCRRDCHPQRCGDWNQEERACQQDIDKSQRDQIQARQNASTGRRASRGSVERIQMKTRSSANILARKTATQMMLKITCPPREPKCSVQKPIAAPGKDHPPRKSAVATAETMVMLPYSPRKNMAQRRPLYSVR